MPRAEELKKGRGQFESSCYDSSRIVSYPPSDARPKSFHLSEYDLDVMMQMNAQSVVKTTIEKLRESKCLLEGKNVLSARQVLLYLFEPIVKPAGEPDSPPPLVSSFLATGVKQLGGEPGENSDEESEEESGESEEASETS